MDSTREVTSSDEARRILLKAHYYLMQDKRFWYDKALQEASKMLRVRASDILIAQSKVLG